VTRHTGLLLALWLALPALATSAGGNEKLVTWTGWFSDRSCAAPFVARGEFAPNNPDCVKKCLDKGVAPVFISEQAKAMFEVRDYVSVKDDVGYLVELTGVLDEAVRCSLCSSASTSRNEIGVRFAEGRTR
jgi:hypothetical protein